MTKVTLSRTIRCLALPLMAAAGLFAPLANAQYDDVDPYMEVNRKVYGFNQSLDGLVFKPVTETYDFTMPTFAKRGVTNLFNNLDDINAVLNDLLQLKMSNALHDSSRFLVNTTIGVAGIFDVATGLGLYKNYEDFGQTLGYWGVPAGPYVVLPLLGTSNVRDAIGKIPDSMFNPVFWVNDSEARFFLYSLDNIDTRLFYMAAASMVSGDEYIFVRDAYLQRREYLVADGEVYDQWDDF
jgi:phospholipid-binding lipoprotein MlaA